MVQVASGQAPDVVYVAIEGCRMMVKNNLFLPVNDMLTDADGKKLQNEIPKAAWDAFTVNGKIYEMPFDANSIVLHYNPKMYKAAGLKAPGNDYTWDQYVKDLKALTKGSGSNKVYGTIINPAFLWPYFLANNVSVMNDDWTASNLKDPKVKETLQNLYDLIYKYKVAPVPETNDDVGNMLCAGRVATINMGMYYTATYEANHFKDFDMAIMPRGKDGGVGCFGVGGLAITSGCKYPQAAYALCKEFSSIQMEKTQAKTGTSVPLIKSVAESTDFLSHAPHVSVQYSEIENGKTMPAPANYSEMSKIITTMATNILTNSTSIDAAIAQADKELTASLKK
jgi:multiple sugar transport system substrate-binding protein